MSVFDALKIRKFNKLYKQSWDLIWQQVKNAPEEETAVVAHLCFVGTLLYALRFQVALAVGMGESFARSMAVVVVSKAGYDKPMEDEIYAVFSVDADAASKEYAACLGHELSAVVAQVQAGTPPAVPQLAELTNRLNAHYGQLCGLV